MGLVCGACVRNSALAAQLELEEVRRDVQDRRRAVVDRLGGPPGLCPPLEERTTDNSRAAAIAAEIEESRQHVELRQHTRILRDVVASAARKPPSRLPAGVDSDMLTELESTHHEIEVADAAMRRARCVLLLDALEPVPGAFSRDITPCVTRSGPPYMDYVASIPTTHAACELGEIARVTLLLARYMGVPLVYDMYPGGPRSSIAVSVGEGAERVPLDPRSPSLRLALSCLLVNARRVADALLPVDLSRSSTFAYLLSAASTPGSPVRRDGDDWFFLE